MCTETSPARSRQRAGAIYVGCLCVAAALIYGALRCLDSVLALVTGPRVHTVAPGEQIEAALAALTVVVAAAAWTAWCVALSRVWRSMQGHPRPPVYENAPTPWLRVAALALGVSGLAVSPGAAVAATGADRSGPDKHSDRGDRFNVDHLHGLAMPTLPSAGRVAARATVHVVMSGDSLWRLAADGLPPGAPEVAVDARWRRIYAHNRSTVGDDPDLLVPGQRLQMPTFTTIRPRSQTP